MLPASFCKATNACQMIHVLTLFVWGLWVERPMPKGPYNRAVAGRADAQQSCRDSKLWCTCQPPAHCSKSPSVSICSTNLWWLYRVSLCTRPSLCGFTLPIARSTWRLQLQTTLLPLASLHQSTLWKITTACSASVFRPCCVWGVLSE